jgi:hypothetical protein
MLRTLSLTLKSAGTKFFTFWSSIVWCATEHNIKVKSVVGAQVAIFRRRLQSCKSDSAFYAVDSVKKSTSPSGTGSFTPGLRSVKHETGD